MNGWQRDLRRSRPTWSSAIVLVTLAFLVVSCGAPPASSPTASGATNPPPVATATTPVTPVVPLPTSTDTAVSSAPTTSTEPPRPKPSTTATARAVLAASASATVDAPPPIATQPLPTATQSPVSIPSPVVASGNAAAPQPSTRANRLGNPGRIFLAYYVPYDTTSWASLEAYADQIDYVATQTVFIDPCGNLSTQDNRTLHAFARQHGIGVLPSVFTTSGAVNHLVLTDDATSSRIIRELVDYVVAEGYAGLDVDLEGVYPEDRPALTRFVERLSAELRSRGKLLTMAVPAKARDARTGWAGAFDYAALGPHVDLMTVMTYGYTTSQTPPGSTAPQSWVDQVMAFVVSQVAPEKVLLGVPVWGYDWNVTLGGSARALIYPQAQALANQYEVEIRTDPATQSATFTYVALPGDPPAPSLRPPQPNHEIALRQPPPCDLPRPTPRPTEPPRPTPIPPPRQEHVVWLEDVASFEARLGLANQHGTGGIAIWRLGQEDPRIWEVLAAWRSSSSQ